MQISQAGLSLFYSNNPCRQNSVKCMKSILKNDTYFSVNAVYSIDSLKLLKA